MSTRCTDRQADTDMQTPAPSEGSLSTHGVRRRRSWGFPPCGAYRPGLGPGLECVRCRGLLGLPKLLAGVGACEASAPPFLHPCLPSPSPPSASPVPSISARAHACSRVHYACVPCVSMCSCGLRVVCVCAQQCASSCEPARCAHAGCLRARSHMCSACSLCSMRVPARV